MNSDALALAESLKASLMFYLDRLGYVLVGALAVALMVSWAVTALQEHRQAKSWEDDKWLYRR